MAEPARCTAALAVHGGTVQRVAFPPPLHGLAPPPMAGLTNCLHSHMWLMVKTTC